MNESEINLPMMIERVNKVFNNNNEVKILQKKMSNFYGSICLSDIPKRLIEDGKNGKKYLRIEAIEMKQVGQYGDTHFIVASCKKENRIDGEKLFIGNLKPSKFDKHQDSGVQNSAQIQSVYGAQQQPIPAIEPGKESDDLPF